MESIEALRRYARGYETLVNHKLLAIADAIEQEVEQEVEAACAEAYGNGVESVALPDMTAYVKLPVDADGVPIHVGDMLDGYAPTVEDVLREFAAKVEPSWRVTELPNATIAEFAAKLRLAGDE